MILFKEDWDKYPDAIIDKDTKNESFLRLASVYREMGVENNSFILALHNPDLQGLDPFSSDLQLEDMIAISLECQENPWYFFREIARAPGLAGGGDIPFKASRGNMGVYWLFFNHMLVLLEQIRQTGKSFGLNTLNVYLLNLGSTGTDISLITKDDGLRSETLERIRDIESTLPFYLRQRTKGDISNTEEIQISKHNNKFKGYLPSKSPKQANGLGRGITSPVFENDEAAFCSNIAISLPAALAAGVAARDIARRNNSVYGTIIATTSGMKDDIDGRFIYGMMQAAFKFNEKLFDAKDADDLLKIVLSGCKSSKSGLTIPRVYCSFNHRQLGYTDEWLKLSIMQSESSGDAMLRDFFNRWTSGAQKSPFSREVAEAIRESVVDDHYLELSGSGGYATRWYIPQSDITSIMNASHYTLSLDTSDAVGQDDIGMTIMDDETGAVVAAGDYNETNLIVFSEWLLDWCVRFENITLMIERKSSGVAIIDNLIVMMLKKGMDPFKRIFNRVVNDADSRPEDFEEINKPMYARNTRVYTDYRRAFGFATSGSGITARSEIYGNTFNEAVKYTATIIKDKTLIDQLLGLVIKNNRLDHEDGANDDLCFVGDTLVRTDTGNRPIKDLKIGDYVLTRQGYKPIVKLFKSNKEVITKYGMTGTPNHPFITPNGEIQFKDLRQETVVYKWNEKQSIIEEKTIIDILSQIDHNSESISTDTINGMNPQFHFIDKFMRIFTGLFHQSTKFTTKTVITLITLLATWNVCRSLNIVDATPCPMKKEPDARWLEKLRTVLLNGKKQISMSLGELLVKTEKSQPVSLIGERITQNLQERSTQKQEERAQKYKEKKEIVYNIMVADCHEYFVNDILVHNCISWLLAYWLLSKGRHLDFYGKNVRAIMSKNTVARSLNKPDVVLNHQEQYRLRCRIDEVADEIRNTRDEYVVAKLEAQLKALSRHIVLNQGERFSVDALIEELREDRVTSLVSKEASQIDDKRFMPQVYGGFTDMNKFR